MAEWTASTMAEATCAPAGSNTAELDLSDWQVVAPTADIETIEQTRLP
jgi:hypothetical protein